MKIVIIEWHDAHTTENEELKPEDIETSLHFAWRTSSVGFLIRSDEKGVSLASDFQHPQGGVFGDVSHWRGASFVPRGMISKETVIDAPDMGHTKPKRQRKKKPTSPPEAT